MKVRRDMTADELEAALCLIQVRFPPCSWDKRFARNISLVTTITEKEAPQLWRLFIRYRRQISHPRKSELLAIAEKLSAPDLRKLEAQKREQARIDEMKLKYQEAMNA